MGNKDSLIRASEYLSSNDTHRIFCIVDKDDMTVAGPGLSSHCPITDLANMQIYALDVGEFREHVSVSLTPRCPRMSLRLSWRPRGRRELPLRGETKAEIFLAVRRNDASSSNSATVRGAYLPFLAFFFLPFFAGVPLEPFGVRVSLERTGGARLAGVNIFIGRFSMTLPCAS
jgi:hypothetical protein